MPVASAQVKSCVLLAGLTTSDGTTVVEPAPSRDDTERMLARAGAPIERDGMRVTVRHTDELELDTIDVPGDLSSAAFLVAAAVLVPGSRIVSEDVNVNWTRTGFLRILERMGAILLGELEPQGAFAPVALLCCFAEGETIVRGAQELRVKESDRIATVVDGLNALGSVLEATGVGC